MPRFTGVIIAVLSACAFYGTGHPALFMLAVFNLFLCLWSWAGMQEYAANWVVPLNWIFASTALGLLILGTVLRVWF